MGKTEKTTHDILVKLPVEQHDRLRESASKEDRSVSAEVRRAIRLYLESAE